MATKKPLVISNGQLEQLQPGDQLESNQITQKTNNSGGAVPKGTPVYTDGAGTFDEAQADDLATSRVFGLVADASIADATPGAILTDGVLFAATGEWDAVTGETGGLTPGALYFLDPSTVGMLTQTAPTTVGQVVAEIGQALSANEMEVSIRRTVRL